MWDQLGYQVLLEQKVPLVLLAFVDPKEPLVRWDFLDLRV